VTKTKFICGCVHEIDSRELSEHLTYDGEGFVVCRQHLQRRYGWRSLPTFRGKPDYLSASVPPVKREAFFLFGEHEIQPH
jgi:hypothetical protein